MKKKTLATRHAPCVLFGRTTVPLLVIRGGTLAAPAGADAAALRADVALALAPLAKVGAIKGELPDAAAPDSTLATLADDVVDPVADGGGVDPDVDPDHGLRFGAAGFAPPLSTSCSLHHNGCCFGRHTG